MACYLIDRDGRALGSNFGEFDVDENLRKNYSNIAAQIWGGLSQVEGLGGDIDFVVAKFANFKILGIPIPGSTMAVLVTIPISIDSEVLKARILGFVRGRRKDAKKN